MESGAPETLEPTEPKAPNQARRRGCLSWRRVGCAGLVGLGLLAMAAAGGGYYVLTPGGQSWIKDQVVSLIQDSMVEGDLAVDSLSFGLDWNIHVGGVVLRDVDGREIAVIDQAHAVIVPWALLGGEVHLTSLELTGVRGDLLIDEAGQLDVVRLFAVEADPNAEPFAGLPVDLRFDEVRLRDSRVAVRGLERDLTVENLEIDTAFTAAGLRFGVDGLKVRGHFVDPRDGPLAVDGRLVWQGAGVEDTELEVTALKQRLSLAGHARDLGGADEAVDLVLRVDQLDLDDIDDLTGAGIAGQFAGQVVAKGTLDALGLSGSLVGQNGTEGALALDGSIDTQKPAWSGALKADGLRIDHLLKGMTDPFPLSTALTVEGAGSEWPDGVAMTGRLSDTQLEIVGIQLDSAAATLSLDKGIIGLSDIDARGPSGHITGTASIDLQRSMVLVDAHVAELDTRHLRSVFVPAELDGTRGGGDVHVEVDFSTPDVLVDVSGTVDMAPLRWTSDIRANRAAGSFAVRVRGADVDVDTDVRTWGLNAYGYTSDTAGSQGVEIRVRPDGVTGKGGVTLGPGRYVFVPEGFTKELGQGLEVSGGSGTWSMEQGVEAQSPLQVVAGIDVGSHKISRYPGSRGRIDVNMVGSKVGVTARLDATASRRLVDLQTTMNLGDLSFVFDQLQFAPEPGQTWTARPGATLRVAGVGVDNLDMDLRSARGHIAVGGSVGLEGPQDLHVDIYDLDLLAVAELIPMWAQGIEGYVGGIIDVDGTAESPIISASIEGADVGYSVAGEDGPVPLLIGLGSRLTVTGADRRVRVDGGVGVDGTPIARLALDLPFDTAFASAGFRLDAPIDATVEVVPGGLRRFGDISGYSMPTNGQVQGRFTIGETLTSPSIAVDVTTSADLQTLGTSVTLLGSVRRDSGDALTWEARMGEGETKYLSSAGSASTRLDEALRWALVGGVEPDFADPAFWLGEIDAEVRLQKLPVATILDLAAVPVDATGELGGVIEISGTAMQPKVKGRATLLDGRAGTVAFQNAALVFEADSKGYNVGLNADILDINRKKEDDGMGTLFVAGHVPLVPDFARPVAEWVTGEMALRVDADLPLALASAYDSGIRQARGLLEVDGQLAGSPLDPKPHLDIFVGNDARFAYRPVGVLFSQLEASISFDEHAVTFHRLSAMTSPSSATGQFFNVFNSAADSVEGSLLGRARKKRQAKAQAKAKERADGRGRILASGSAKLKNWLVDALDLRLTLDRALFLRDGDQYIRLSTDVPLTVTGNVRAPKVAGGVRVDGANVFVDYETLAGGGSTTLDPRILIVRPGVTQQIAATGTSLFDNVSIDLTMDLGTSATGRIIMPIESAQALGSALTTALKVDVQARLQGKLRYRQNPCSVQAETGGWTKAVHASGRCGLFDPEVTGSIDISDGAAKVFQSAFELENSSVSFIGNEVYNPNIDINGTMDADGLQIKMAITGTAYEPVPSFTSTDTDQVLLAIITGRDPDTIASSSASHLLSLVATAALGSALAGVNLPLISIDASGQVQVGLNVTRRLFVQATLGGTPSPDENVVEVEVEYTLYEGLLIRSGTGAYAVPFWLDVLFERGFD